MTTRETENPDFDEATLVAIEEAEHQLDGGDGISLEAAFEALRGKYSTENNPLD